MELRENRIREIPLDVCNLRNLIKLDLSNNLLTNIPQDIILMTNLKILDLKGNNFDDPEIQVNSRKSLPTLMTYLSKRQDN